MAYLDFFAARQDMLDIFSFLFEETDVRVMEKDSAFGEELREFRSIDALCQAFDIGSDLDGNGYAACFQLWSPSIDPTAKPLLVKLDPESPYCQGHAFRYEMGGAGVMQLYLGGVHNKLLVKSHFGHCTPARILSSGFKFDIDWKGFSRLSSKIQSLIRRKFAVAHAPKRPILTAAFDLAKVGYVLTEDKSSPITYPLQPDGSFQMRH